MSIEINIEDYLSAAEMKDIVIEELRGKLRGDAERILSNMVYSASHSLVDSIVSEYPEFYDLLRKRVGKIAQELRGWDIFRKEDAWQNQESIGHKILVEAIKAQEGRIYEGIKNAVEGFEYEKYLGGLEPHDMVVGMLKAALKGDGK